VTVHILGYLKVRVYLTLQVIVKIIWSSTCQVFIPLQHVVNDIWRSWGHDVFP